MLIHSDYKDFDFKPFLEKVALILIDPPYNIGVKPWDRIEDYSKFTKEWLGTVYPILMPGGFVFSFIDPKQYHIIANEGIKAGFVLSDPIFWAYRERIGAVGSEMGKFFEKRENENIEYEQEHTLFGDKPKQVRAGLGTGETHFQNVRMEKFGFEHYQIPKVKLTTDNARKWDDWWSQQKVCFEMITVLQRPMKQPLYKNLKEHNVGAFNLGSTKHKGRKDYSGYRSNEIYHPNMIWTSHFMRDSFPFFLDFNLHPMDNPYWQKDKLGLVAVCNKPSTKEKGEYNTHFSVKPIELCKYLIKLVTIEGQLVVDIFAGTGTTHISCIDTHRQCISIEKDLDNYNIMGRRVKEYVENGHQDSLLDTGSPSAEKQD